MRDKKLLNIIWVLCLVLILVIMILVNTGFTASLWISMVFLVASYIGVFLFTKNIVNELKDTNDKFLALPAASISVIYLILESIEAIVFSLGSGVISYRITLLICALTAIVSWILIISSSLGKDKIKERM